MALSFTVFNKFRAIDGVTAPVKRMEKTVGKFGKTATREFKKADRASKGLSLGLKSLAKTILPLASVTAVTAGFVDLVHTGAEFEQTIVNAAAKFGGAAKLGSKNFKELEAAAKRAGATTEFTAKQAAEGLNFLAMAGFDVKQSIAALPGVIDLATAAGLDLGRASDIATDTLGAFNLVTKDATQLQKNLARVTDVMAKTTTTANVNMEQLFETFTYAAPSASSLGASIETVAAMAGVLGGAGIKASVAGTTLKNVFIALSATTPKASKALKQIGVSVKDSSGNFRDVFDILEDINKGLAGLGTAQKQAVLKDIFGRIPIAGVNVLLKKGAAGLREYRKQLERSGGAAKKMAAMMRSTIQTRFKILISTLESVKLTVFSSMAGDISATVTKLTVLVRVMGVWLEQNKTGLRAAFSAFAGVIDFVVGSFATLVGYITTFLKANSDLVPVLKVVVGLFIAYKTAMAAASAATAIFNGLMAMNPLGLFVLSLTAVVLGIKAIRDNWKYLVDDFRRFISGTLNIVIKELSKLAGMAAKVGAFLGFDTSGIARAAEEMSQIQTRVVNYQVQTISPNAGASRVIREERKQQANVSVDFLNLPDFAQVKQDKEVPGFSLNVGFAGAS